jgi:hypothetical protein
MMTPDPYEQYVRRCEWANEHLSLEQRELLMAQLDGKLPGAMTREQWNQMYRTQEPS